MIRKQQNLILVAALGILAATSAGPLAVQAAVPTRDQSDSEAIPPAAAELVASGQKAVKAGNLPLAVIHFKNASSVAPRNGKIRAQLGVLLMQTQDYYSAERELRQARKDGAPDQAVLPSLFQVMLLRREEKSILEEFPESAALMNPAMAADIFKAHAMAFQATGEPAKAVAAMEKSLKARRDVAGLMVRASLAQQQRDLPAAISFAEEASKMSPANSNVTAFRVRLLLEARKLDAALALCDEAIAKNPADTALRFSRVETLMQMNQDAKANAELNTIAAKNPENAATIYYRALLMAKDGKTRDAWRTAQTLPPQFLQLSPEVAVRVAQLATQAGATETAASILNTAIAKFPREPNLRLRLAAIRLQQSNTGGALNALEPIRDSLDPATAEMLAKVYVRAGQRSEALALLEKLDDSGKGNDATTLAIIGLQAQQGQTEAAMKRLIQANAQNPTNPALAAQLVSAFSSAGRFAEAMATADRLGADPTQRASALALRGQVLLMQGKRDEALDAANKAVAADPKSAVALNGRSSVFLVMKRYQEANKDLQAASAINPKDVSVYLRMADIASVQNNPQEVKNILARAIKQAPDSPAPRIALARYLLAQKDNAGALAAANDLARLQPKNAQALALLGYVQGLAGQKPQAVATFRRLVEVAPQSSSSYLLLGSALSGSDRAGAAAALKKAVTLDTKSPEVRVAQINLLIGQGAFEDAIASARAFRTVSPGSVADLLLGDTLAKAGRRDQAFTVYKESFAAHPNADVLIRIVQVHIANGDQKSALATMSGWLADHPKDNGVRIEYANLLMSRGEKVRAITQYEAILKAQPDNVLALNNLGWLKQNEDPKQAIALVSRAVRLAPDMPEVLDTLAWLKLQQKQPAGTVEMLQKAHKLRPNDGQITYHLVMALDANGKREDARRILKTLLGSKVKFEDLEAAQKLNASWQ